MGNSKTKIIKEIAQELDCGNECYYNSKTDEIITIPNFSNFPEEEEFRKHFKTELKTVKKNKADLIKIKSLESFETFKIMEQFTDQITDKQFRLELINTLQKNKPFQNFKHLIDNSDFRQEWFDFKQIELERIIGNQLK